ncbi:MAG TPA: diguanylate cyclase [Candidatus Limnocylindrales bacterium]|nr:diguanylate cyclase [Candidatus Limnocylindrales bacterium]
MKVLIAEDDAVSRVMLTRTLQRFGYKVVAVDNGVRALKELHREDPPRLALLDWVMPQKDGADVCREVRFRKNRAYTYLILLSSRESKKEIVEGLEAGADDYLTKPFDPEELKARLRSGERILQLEDRLVEARESMRFQATHDLLTSLWNRSIIVELMSREIHRSRREKSCTAVMLCDIDHFKKVNDNFGHSTGDEVLQEVANRLQHSVRSYDMVGRYGGEEFLVILNKCDPASAQSRAENLRCAICNKPIPTRSGALTVTMSVGVALTTEFVNHDVDAIIQEADAALYAAKAGGRNCVRMSRRSEHINVPDASEGEVALERR